MSLRQPSPRSLTVAFGAGLAAFFAYLVARNYGLLPMVFADEWFYSSSARLHPLSEAVVPSYLFLALYGGTSWLGEQFLEGVRVLNAAFLVGAAPFLYLIARPLCGRGPAMAVAMLGVMGAANSYTAYFMPEPMYFFLFCVLSWGAMAWRGLRPWQYGLALGAVLGLLATTKVHALFLAPAMVLFLLFRSWTDYRAQSWLGKALLMIACALAAMALLRFSIGYLLAGPAGLHLYGNFYKGVANTSTSSLDKLLALLPATFVSLKGHLMALALLVALPLATIALQASPAGRKDGTAQLRLLIMYAFLMLGATVAMTALYTASIASHGPGEGTRLHLRYYNFVFPLLFIVAIAPLGMAQQFGRTGARAVLAAGLGALIVFAVLALQPAYTVSHVDGPELAAMTRTATLLYTLSGLALMTLAVWTVAPRRGAQLFLFLLLPLTVVNGERASRRMFEGAVVANAYDRAGMAARQHVSREEAKRLTVVGEGSGLLRALFHIDSPGAEYQDIATGAPYTSDLISPRRAWVLVVGPRALPADLKPVLQTPEYALFKVDTMHRPYAVIQMAQPAQGGLISSFEGLSHAESWGRWSSGKQVRLQFARPLPKSLTVLIKASAFGPNIDKDFVMQVGTQRKTFRLAGAAQDRLLSFDTDGAATTLTIDVPQPTSPEALGQPGDPRTLGIALSELELGDRAR